MVARLGADDDRFVEPADKSALPRAGARPADWKTVEDVLGLLARAVQQLHTYPPSSPICVAAIAAAQRGIAAMELRDRLAFRVTPSELIVDDVPTGRGSLVGHELARRLHRASVASVIIDRTVSAREVGRFCEDLIRTGERGGSPLSLLELVTEHGLDRIGVEMASRPEVLDVPSLPPGADERLARERTRFEAQLARGGAVNHLYPPQKGWVRLDPGAAPRSVSLLDLAVLVDDPATLAAMLLRLTDDVADVAPEEALQRKYSDVTMLISALDPQVARRMFARLARAVLDLEPGARQALLRRSVLPGLLDGRVDGAILRDFPDLDLAESLCLLLDLEAAAPELLTTALSRLELPAERHAAVVPLLEAQLRARESGGADAGRQATLARHARELVRVDAGSEKNFAEFAAFDLSLDAGAVEMLGQIRAAVPSTDTLVARLTCLLHLLRLEPNPEIVSRFLERSFGLLTEVEAVARGRELPEWLGAYRELAERLRETRPDVAEVILAQLAAFCTPDRAAALADLWASGPEGRDAAGALIAAVGTAVAAPLADLIAREAEHASPGAGRGRAAAQLLMDHAATLAPALPPLLEGSAPAVARALLRVLGSAGAGYEDAIATHLSSADEHVAREALRALARVGTPRAAGFVVARVVKGRGALSAAAEETLWHFPPAEAQRRARELLARRDFMVGHPRAAERLLDRAARMEGVDLEPALLHLAPLRFRIWNPALARVARKAHSMLKQ